MKTNFFTQPLLIVFFFSFFIAGTNLNAQVGQEFWFVAPEVTEEHGDREVVFHFTAFDEAANVSISMPRENGFTETTIAVPANSHQTVSYNSPDIFENYPPGEVLEKGILITSDADISAYYEIAHPNNPDKFTLKGDNALGTEFYIPSQNEFQNHATYTGAKERVDIVSTENNTTVEITLPSDVSTTNHAAGSSFTITLDRGETYSLEAPGSDADIHLGGIRISSDKKIAVTISDDSIEWTGDENETAGHWDLIGDQLIPTDVIGTEYIAMHTTYGESITTDQKVFILAVEDNTYLEVDGQYKKTLSEGELYGITINENASYIKSDKPVYAYQVTGIPPGSNSNATRGTELGSAILPGISCTGSTSVSFTRILTDRFFVQLMTKDGNKDGFSIEGPQNNGVPASHYLDDLTWTEVEGSGENGEEPWVSTVIKMSDPGIATGDPYTISNNGLFHMSILDENGLSMSFGYFSDYSSLRIDGPGIFCESDNKITLTTQEPMETYTWYHELNEYTDTMLVTGVQSIEVDRPGKYWVTSDVNPQCQLTDTVEILSVTPEFSLGEDTVVCPGDLVTFDITATNADTYLWLPDGSTGTSYSVAPDPGEEIEVQLTVENFITSDKTCSRSESVMVTGRTVPEFEWSVSGNEICLGDTLKAVITSEEDIIAEYQWSIDGTVVPDHNEPFIVPAISGADYMLTVITDDNCDTGKSINLTVHDLPDIDISDAAVCPGEDYTFQVETGFSNYLWQGEGRANTLSTTNSLNINSSDSIYVQVTDNNGCINQDSAFFEIYNEQVFSFGTDTSVCIGSPIEIEILDDFTDYQWEFEGNPLTTSPDHIYSITSADNSDEGTYTITAIDQNGCDVSGSFNLDVQELPDIGIAQSTNICEGNMIEIGIDNPLYTSFEWINTNDPNNILSDESYLLIDQSGTYQLTATQDNGCSRTATTVVNTFGNPTFDLPDEISYCPNEQVSLEFNPDPAAHNWQSNLPSNAERTPRNHIWYTRSENGDTIRYHEGIDLGEKDAGNPEPGVYFLKVSDELCSFIDQVEISYHELTEVELEDAEICDNETYSLEIPTALLSEVDSYQWSQDGTSNHGAASSNWTVSENGNYSLNIEDNNGCSNSGTMTLTHLPAPKFVLGADDDKCLGDTLMVMTEPTFIRYEWNGNTDDGQTNVHTTTASGYDLDFSLQIWDKNGCTATQTASVDVFALPDVDLGDDRMECPGHEITLTVPDFEEIYWTNKEQNVTSIRVANGKHKVKVVDENGCVSSDSMLFSWHKVPEVDLGPDIHICPVEYPVQIEAPEGFESYTWHNGSQGRLITANLMDTLNTVHIVDDHGCIGWDTKVVSILPNPVYSLGNDTTACDSDELIINAGSERIAEYAGEQTITPFIDYRWNTGNDQQFQEITEPGNYWVEIFDGCFYLRDTMHIDYYPTPEIIRLDTTYYAQVTVLADNGTQPYQFALDNEDRLQNDNTFKNVENGEHTAFVEDRNGCKAYTVFTLNSQYDIDVPNFFTPNNDGFNDTWVIDGLERLPDSEVSIFDRYGKLLRKFNASESISWDGEYQDKPVPSDDYWYVIYLQPIDKLIKGNVTVKR